MTARDRELMAPQSQVASFMASIRRQQSGDYNGNYPSQGPDGIGAYGISQKNWRVYAAATGLRKANWRDPRAQDAVAKAKITSDYQKYGDWSLVAVAWYAGNAAADAMQQQGTKVDDTLIRKIAGEETADYVAGVAQYGSEISESEWGQASGNQNLLAGTPMTPPGQKPQNAAPSRAEDMVRQRLQDLAGINGVPSSDARPPTEEAPV